MIPIDDYVLDVLMADLVGHDRSPSAYLIYLYLWRSSLGRNKLSATASLMQIAFATGLAKSSVQNGLRILQRRGLVTQEKAAVTAVPSYQVQRPWRR